MRRKKTVAVCLLLLLTVCSRGDLDAKSDSGAVRDILQQIYAEEAPEAVLLSDGDPSCIASLRLSLQTEDPVYYTFAGERLLSGSADPDTWILTVVYTLNQAGRPIIWYYQETVVGGSGLYQEDVPLQLIGTQYLMVACGIRQRLECRLYENCRKSEEVLSELLEDDFNLYEEFGRS